MKLTKSFFNKSTEEVAKVLLGCCLMHETHLGIIKGKIVETEAYLQNDEASHSFSGKTKRNEAMFGPPGKAYVYFTYGMYNCFNVVTQKRGVGEAVLIRALEPLSGIEIMKKFRRVDNLKQLCDGPAKLVIAFGINREHNGSDLLSGKLRILPKNKNENFQIQASKRIGITKAQNHLLRFYIAGNGFVSKR